MAADGGRAVVLANDEDDGTVTRSASVGGNVVYCCCATGAKSMGVGASAIGTRKRAPRKRSSVAGSRRSAGD